MTPRVATAGWAGAFGDAYEPVDVQGQSLDYGGQDFRDVRADRRVI